MTYCDWISYHQKPKTGGNKRRWTCCINGKGILILMVLPKCRNKKPPRKPRQNDWSNAWIEGPRSHCSHRRTWRKQIFLFFETIMKRRKGKGKTENKSKGEELGVSRAWISWPLSSNCIDFSNFCCINTTSFCSRMTFPPTKKW